MQEGGFVLEILAINLAERNASSSKNPCSLGAAQNQSQGTNQLLEGRMNKSDDQSDVNSARWLLCRLRWRFRTYS